MLVLDRAAREGRPILLSKVVDRLVKPCYNTHMNRIDPTLNEFEVILVCEHYSKQGVTNYDLHRGNACIWATRRQISEYFIFRDGKIVDIQID